MSLNLPVTDLEDFAADEREAQALSVIIEESQRPFDLAAGPMLRTKLLRMSERDQILILTMHHIVADAWSMGVLVRDAAAFYKAFAEDSAVSLPELEIQYADYASWQRAWLQPERLAESLSYWKRQLADKPLSMRLPTDKPRPSAQTSNGALYQVELSDELSSELEDLSRRESVSVFMTLLSAFKVALSRYTGSEDIVVGTDVANRSRSEVEGLIGIRTRRSTRSSKRLSPIANWIGIRCFKLCSDFRIRRLSESNCRDSASAGWESITRRRCLI
jgi:hypothetical protein